MVKLKQAPTQLFDPAVPSRLRTTQEWFGGIIGRPMDGQSNMNPISPRGLPMELEACEYIAPSPTLRPAQRIELYNQQYWWRLLSIMHDSFPLLTRLFGYTDFNMTITMPYLTKYPPTHWSLSRLGILLPQWIEEAYEADDKELVLFSAQIDQSYQAGFNVPELPPLDATDSKDPIALLSQKLYLQPHITLFHLPYHLFAFRELFIAEGGDHWIDHDFPLLETEKAPYSFVIFRNIHNQMIWQEITTPQYHLLTLFSKGCSIEQACDRLEKKHPEHLKETMQSVHLWFQEWTARRWLTKQKPRPQ